MDFGTTLVLIVLIICACVAACSIFGKPGEPPKPLTKLNIIEKELYRLHRLLDDTYFGHKTWAAAEASKLHEELIKMNEGK